MTRVNVDADDLERIVRLAHQVDEYHAYLTGVAEDDDDDAVVEMTHSVQCMCGVGFRDTSTDGSVIHPAAAKHIAHVERAVRNARAGRLETP